MHRRYHISMTRQTLQAAFSPAALRTILQASLAQDYLAGQMGHPEYHFDDSAVAAGNAYIERQRQCVFQAVGRASDRRLAWQAFGRLIHAAQDFYAHTNYVRLWLDQRTAAGQNPLAAEIDPLSPAILAHPALASGRNYLGLEIMALLPGLRGWIVRRSPLDAHLRLNLDGPEQGPLFAYALAAAEKRTCHEYDRFRSAFSAAQMQLFWG